MLWRKRYKNRLLKPVAGLILAFFLLELTQFVPVPLLSNIWNDILTAEAATDFIDPNGDGGVIQATPTTCGVGGNFDCVNDAVRQPTAPSVVGDYVTHSRDNVDRYQMSTVTGVDTATSITVWMYHVSGAANFTFNIRLLDASETIQYGTTQGMTNRLSAGWGSVTFSGLSLTQAQLDGLRIETQCVRSGGGNSTCTNYALYAEVTYTPTTDVFVAAIGTQQNIDIGTSNQYVGGLFSIAENSSSRNVTDITITENGTVDAQTNLDNIKLYYEYDTSDPYDCSGLSYDGIESQFGSTVTGGFSGADGVASFTDSANISTTQAMCVYVVLDVLSGATLGQTIELEITDPTTDVTASGLPAIEPPAPVLLSGTTVLEQSILSQTGYHWRNDDGTEVGATSATGGVENTPFLNFPKNVPMRLRFAISNAGNKTADPAQFRLEFTSKVTTCADATGWTDMGAYGAMFDSTFLTDGGDTTDISTSIGGITNPNSNFLTPNGGIRDINSQTGNITLTSNDFVELEYSIMADNSIPDGTTFCLRVTDNGVAIDDYVNYAEATFVSDVVVDTIGTQTETILIPSTAVHGGGAFTIVNQTASAKNIDSITISAAGTVDLQNDISNIKLRYDYDINAPYDCIDESYSVSDTQYGSTASAFDGSGKATFTATAQITPTQTMCVYVEYDVSSNVSNGETLELSINDPSTEVEILNTNVAPTAPVSISGVTTFAHSVVTQAHYHWRNNDGGEADATSATGGAEDTTLTEVEKNSLYRLRFAVGNTGLADSTSIAYRLEWARRVSTCSAAIGWERIDTAGDEWSMISTANLTDGANTTDINTNLGGVSNPATTFLSVNGGVKDTTDTTSGVVLPADYYLELEYAIVATSLATQGATYCFRITDAGTPIDNYTTYPQATIKLDTDFKIQRKVSTITGTSLTLNAGVDYDAPASASNAFIRITNTHHTGAGPDTGNSNNNADDVTAYITNAANITSSVTLQRPATALGSTQVSWEIIEYTGAPGGENEIIVRRQEVALYVADSVTVSGNVENGVVNDGKVVVFITGQSNHDAGRNAFHVGLSTAVWNPTTNQADFTRGGSGSVSDVSYAIVEFTGSNWKIQRAETNYVASNVPVVLGINPVDSLSRTFLHAQKRTSSNNHADFGHEVELTSIGYLTFNLDPNASFPANHVSVAWVIENTQRQGVVMRVTRSNGSFVPTATGPESNNINIGKTLSDLSITSLFVTNRSSEAQRSWPEPILSASIISNTQYELWRSDTTDNIYYKTEVVEWPTAARKLAQNYYSFYVDNNALTPTDPWPVGAANIGENAEITVDDDPVAPAETVRLRMTVAVSSAAAPAGLDSFKLEYSERITSCAAVSEWLPLGEVGSTTALWRGVNNTPVDGDTLSSLLISVANVAGTYEENNPTSLMPNTAFPGDNIEYDWVIQHNGAKDKTDYCFRMTEADGTTFETYNFYPVIRTVGYEPLLRTWRWFDDESNLTPVEPLSAENIAPIDIQNGNTVKLRLTLEESSGAAGVDNKFVLQYSEYADFSQSVFTLTGTSTCLENSIWCYADGVGGDNETITDSVISDADACVSGVGVGCGTHNEGTSTANAVFDQTAFSVTEYEFTIKHAAARANAVYYFRLYDVTTSEVVGLAGASSYPSLVTEGPQLVFSVTGLPAGTTTAGMTTDVPSTATSIDFGLLPLNDDVVVAQRIKVDTNSTEGYQVYKYADQQLLNTYGIQIEPISATNIVPQSWAIACDGLAVSCFGYHTTDATLEGGSGRFAPIDSYASLSTNLSEIMYSSVAAVDTHDVVYRVWVSELQPAGDYQTSLTYLVVPVF